MPKLWSFTYRIIKRILESKGCYYVRCRGSHETWFNPELEREFIVVKHKNEPMRIKTLKTLMKNSGLWEQYFMEFDD